MEEAEESKSSFLFKNALKGLIWLAVILVGFLFAEEFIQDNFQRDIDTVKDQPLILFAIFFASEVVFGIIPPVLFMTTWKILMNVTFQEYVFNLTILTLLSLTAGVIGYFIGKLFSSTSFYKKLDDQYLKQYNKKLKKYGSFLVLVGALTPIPFSATCMMAGSVAIPFRDFMWACASRIFYFIIYGWIVWSFPNLFV
jgi:uncharacterized membrane protein YdjX (TVP38/TMEM64 family)